MRNIECSQLLAHANLRIYRPPSSYCSNNGFANYESRQISPMKGTKWLVLSLSSLLISLTLVGSQGSNSSEPLFYIYPLDESYWWRWPKEGSDCNAAGYLSHEHSQNSGIGPPIDLDSGLYLTWHFSLFSSLYNRFKRSTRRTLDPEKASLFVIPYDLALDGSVNQDSCGKSIR